MQKKILTNECDIAFEAAKILNESFIKAAASGKVLYVSDDILWSKTPNDPAIFIKKLYRINPNYCNGINKRRMFKIKKRDTTYMT